MIVSVICLSTGSTVVRKIGAPGITIACIRSLFAAVIWQALLAAQGRHITWTSLRRIGPAGALFGFNLAAFFAGINHTSIANAEFIGTLSPILVLPASALLFKEQIPWKALPWGIGAVIDVSLVLFSAAPSGRSSWQGNLLVVMAILLWVSYLLAAKHARREGGVDVVEFMATSTLIAGLVLLPVVVVQGRLDDVLPTGGRGSSCSHSSTASSPMGCSSSRSAGWPSARRRCSGSASRHSR